MKRFSALLLSLALFLSLVPTAIACSTGPADQAGIIQDPGPSTAVSGVRHFASMADGRLYRTEGNFPSWIDRVALPAEGDAFYSQLMEGSDGDGVKDWLIDDSCYRLSGTPSDPKTMSPGDFGFFQEGNLTFSGILVSTLTLNRPWTDKEENWFKTVTRTAYSAFDRDCPEVFWLTGETAICYILRQQESSYTYYVFFPVRYRYKGTTFDLRDAEYSSEKSIRQGIAVREQSIRTILDTVPEGSRSAQVKALNTWLVKHNEYNTAVVSGAWYGRGLNHAPWKCLSALSGRTGRNGPVCEGYARAFKILCNRLNIPCVLVDGKASYLGGAREVHMWNYVQMEDEHWYAVDLTWNDPSEGAPGAVSGRERDIYLLVGADTVLQGTAFKSSHTLLNRVTSDGFAFTNGPILSSSAYIDPDTLVAPFLDVRTFSWYADSVAYVSGRGIMNGTGSGYFLPSATATRGTIAMLLYNLEQRPAVGAPVFRDTPASAWYTDAVTWAAGQGIVKGYGNGSFGPDAPITREQMAQILYQYARHKGLRLEGSANLSTFRDGNTVSSWARSAVGWAVAQDLLTGTGGGSLNPRSTADRAQVATLLMRFCQKTGL